MYIVIDGAKYTAIKRLEFAPEADLTGDTLPINTLSVDIRTEDEIQIGQFARLYDDVGGLWARYWITGADQTERGNVHVEASSLLYLLEYALPAEMYTAASAGTVIGDIITGIGSSVGSGDYYIDPAFAGATVTGFCPAQSARERLQQVCYVLGAYVRDSFSDRLEILPVEDRETLIPLTDTYRVPKRTYGDWVTGIRVKYYTLTEGEPSATDKYVTTGNGVYYIVEEMEATIENEAAPEAVPENVIEISEVYLINGDNVSSILAREAMWRFGRLSVEASVIDNAAYLPGDRVTVYTAENALVMGYIASCKFAFGVQAKGTIMLIGAERVASAALTIVYTCDGAALTRGETLYLPVEYGYTIPTRWLDILSNGVRTVYRPLLRVITGIMSAEGETVEAACTVALRYAGGVLTVNSVDGIETMTETIDDESVIIGVIA